MPETLPPTKAEIAAAARIARRAAQEAAALRANLHRRKEQSRARKAEKPAAAQEPRPDAGVAAKPPRKLNHAAQEPRPDAGVAAKPARRLNQTAQESKPCR